MIDFTTIYMPAFVELTPQEIEDCRDRLERYSRTGWPELDTSPNTVLGDLILTPQAHNIAALEKGMDRFMSDLDLGNVANNIIYNCDFVAQYLNNFATDTSLTQRASGVIRLIFVDDREYVLDRSVKFSIGDGIYSIYLPNNGPFIIGKVGTITAPGVNGTTLNDTGDDVYFADVPVIGNTGESVVSIGDAGMISTPIRELAYINALCNFDSGTDTATLPILAQRTRQTIYAASLNTRNGAIRYVNDVCPFVNGIYAVHNGDKEMLRDYHNPFGVSTGCMDMYIRSKSYAFTETQNVKLALSADKTKFEGPFNYVGQPYYIESVTVPGEVLNNLPHTITSTNDRNLGALAAYSRFEKLSISVDNTLSASGDSIFTISTAADGTKYAIFTVTYRTDPMLPAIAATVENPDYQPVNTSILVRGFIPVIIDRFEVVYVRENGVIPLLDEARDEIKVYLDKLGAPDVYSDAHIAKIMGEAGTKYTREIRVRAHVQWTVADKVANYTGAIEPVMAGPEIRDSGSLRVLYPAQETDIAPADMYACSTRNIRYYLMDGAITFNEVKEI